MMTHSLTFLLFLLFSLLPFFSLADMECNVSDYGATGDGVSDDTAAIRAAIHECGKHSSSTVLFPEGRFVTAPLNMTSGMTFHVTKHAILKGIQDISQWPIVKPLPSYGQGREIPGPRYGPFIGAFNCTNVKITGGGVIDGQGEIWWYLHLNQLLNNTRPRLIEFYGSENVVIEDVTLNNSPFWTLHPVYCKHVTIRNLYILNPPSSPNTDGIDPDSSFDVYVTNTTIHVGDDCVAIKSGMDKAGRDIGMPAENIYISNCTCTAGHGISIGSEMSGGVKNVTITDFVLKDVKSGPRIKTGRGRGGVVENILFKNIRIGSTSTAGISVTMFYQGDHTPTNKTATPIIRDVTFSNIKAENVATYAGEFNCLEDSKCTNFVMEDIDMTGFKHGFNCSFVEGKTKNVNPKACF